MRLHLAGGEPTLFPKELNTKYSLGTMKLAAYNSTI